METYQWLNNHNTYKNNALNILSVPQTLPKGNSKCYSEENRFQMSMGMDHSVSTISTP